MLDPRKVAGVAVLLAGFGLAGFLVERSVAGHGSASKPVSTAATVPSASAASSASAATGVGLSPGNIPPDFTLSTTTGQLVTLSALRGHPVWLNFWATWCPWCKQEIPLIESVKAQYGSGIDIFGVDIQEPLPTVTAYMTLKNMNYPVLLDKTGAVAASYGVQGLPTSVFIGASGRVVAVYTGAFLSKATLDPYLQQLLNTP